MSGRVQNRRAIIVGSGGIGGATARKLHEEGAHIGLVDVDPDAVEQTAASLSDGRGKVFALALDIGDPDAASEAVDRTAAALGGLDTVVHAAAAREPTATTEEMKIADWNEVVRINLSSVFFLCKFALPHLRTAGGGVIVTIASQFGSVANCRATCLSRDQGCRNSIEQGCRGRECLLEYTCGDHFARRNRDKPSACPTQDLRKGPRATGSEPPHRAARPTGGNCQRSVVRSQ